MPYLRCRPLAAVAFALVSAVNAVPAMAQPPGAAPSTRYQVTVVRVKPDMLNEWIDLQKNEIVPAQKKAGVKERTVWATAVGNAFEFTIVVPFEKWALMDGPPPVVTALGAEAAARLNAKIRRCVEVQRTFMTNRIDDLNDVSANALVMRSVVRRIQPGKMQEYQSLYRADIFPGLKKAKAAGKLAGSTFSIRGAGAQAGEFTTTRVLQQVRGPRRGQPAGRSHRPGGRDQDQREGGPIGDDGSDHHSPSGRGPELLMARPIHPVNPDRPVAPRPTSASTRSWSRSSGGVVRRLPDSTVRSAFWPLPASLERLRHRTRWRRRACRHRALRRAKWPGRLQSGGPPRHAS